MRKGNPFLFSSPDHSVLNEAEVQHVIQSLERLRPRIINFSSSSPKNTLQSLAIRIHIREPSQFLSQESFFEVYLYGEKNESTNKIATLTKEG